MRRKTSYGYYTHFPDEKQGILTGEIKKEKGFIGKMAKTLPTKKEKIVSALSLWREYDLTRDLRASVLDVQKDEHSGLCYERVAFNGRETEDGGVRVFAYFARPAGMKKCPAVLLLKEAEKPMNPELMQYFVQKGYAVLMPDYSGAPNEAEVDLTKGEGLVEEIASSFHPEAEILMGVKDARLAYTFYPASIRYANLTAAQGMYDLEGISAEKTCWFEWTYVALYALKYLKSREDIEKIGVVGIRTGGEVAWKTMLSQEVSCGVAVNAAGWLSAKDASRSTENAGYLTDERHRYIAGIDSQSYAPFVKCPVLMLCALSDYSFDYDRAYATYGRIGGDSNGDGHAIVYSPDSGSCIGEEGLTDLNIFLEKHLKGREIFIPSSLNIAVRDEADGLRVEVFGDEEGIVEEMGVCYAEADPETRSTYREWQCVYRQKSPHVKDGKISCFITPYEGAKTAYVYAYAKYLNGFTVSSKVAVKPLAVTSAKAKGSRMLFSGTELDCFSVAEQEDYSVAGVFLETKATPKLVQGYGGIWGAYSVGGLKTYKISSPRYVASDGDCLKFDVYSPLGTTITIGVEVVEEEGRIEKYFCHIPVKAGGKWKRIILEAKDFKNKRYGRPLTSFSLGSALSFHSEEEKGEYAVTNILWL